MHRSFQIAGAACLVFATASQAQTSAALPSASASSQSSAGAPERMPHDIPYGPPVALDVAKHLLALAEAEARRRDWKMNIAVVDPHGDLVASERMDGAQYASVEVSQRKARTQGAHVRALSA